MGSWPEDLVHRRDRVQRAGKADERCELVDGFTDGHGLDADVERGSRVRRQLRQRLQARQHGDRDEFTGLVIQDAGVEDVSEDEPAQEAHQLRIVVGRSPVTWPEQALVRRLGMRPTIGHLGALLIGRHGEQPFAGDEHLVKDQLCTRRSTNGSPGQASVVAPPGVPHCT